MTSIVECVPNISEGRDQEVIKRLAAEVDAVSGVRLLHVDSGYDANRSVFTFVGTSGGVIEAAFALIRKAVSLIDMRSHSGEHPTIGAVDVCPFVPLQGVTIEHCKTLADELAKRVAAEFGIPVFLYAQAAKRQTCVELSEIRRGGFKGLDKRFDLPDGGPDYGPKCPHPSFGALITGARPILVAYNINLATNDIKVARLIAAKLRSPKTAAVNQERSYSLKACRAIGWMMHSYGNAQVSTNLLDYPTTGLHHVYERTKEIAQAEYGIDVQGSEVIGLLPLQALLDAGRFYGVGSSDTDIVQGAIEALGLNSISKFVLGERVLEFAIPNLKP